MRTVEGVRMVVLTCGARGEAHRRAVEVSAYVCTQSGAMCSLPQGLRI